MSKTAAPTWFSQEDDFLLLIHKMVLCIKGDFESYPGSVTSPGGALGSRPAAPGAQILI